MICLPGVGKQGKELEKKFHFSMQACPHHPNASASKFSCKCVVSYACSLSEVYILQQVYRGSKEERDVGSASAIRGCVGGSRWGAIGAAY